MVPVAVFSSFHAREPSRAVRVVESPRVLRPQQQPPAWLEASFTVTQEAHTLFPGARTGGSAVEPE